MSSVLSGYAQIPNNNRLYINVTGINSTIFADDSAATGLPDGITRATWVNDSAALITALSTPGQAVLRDMGKTVFLSPALTTGQTASPFVSTVLRRVQYIPAGGNGVGGSYYTGYIRLGGVTYGGGDGVPTGVARLG